MAPTCAADYARPMPILIRVCVAHFASHFHIMTIPAIILFAPAWFGVDYLLLGVAISAFNLATLLTQAPVGWLADRFGGRLLLTIGLIVGSASFLAFVWFQSAIGLVIGMVAAGLANSVYHPANYSLLSGAVPAKRMGRAYSLHTFAGFAGGAFAPLVLFPAAVAWGPAIAFLVSSLVGLFSLVVLWLPGARWPARVIARSEARGADEPRRRIITGSVIVLTFLFVLLNLSVIPLQNFSIAILAPQYSVVVAGIALAVFMVTNALGVLVGGWLADRTARHGTVGAVAFGVNAVAVAVIAIVELSSPLLVALMAVSGLLSGVIAPSRDMLVRSHARPGTEGRVFGFVSIGFSIAGTIGPVVFGWMLDSGLSSAILLVCAVTMVATALLSWLLDRRPSAFARVGAVG